jgi:hypothetical protein
MYPCADDSVSIGQALGAQGDVNFAEYGETTLDPGDTEKVVTFDYQKESSLYVFEYLYVKGSNDPPDAIIAVPYAQTTRTFTVRFSGAPIATGAKLVWRVKIPDPLRIVCEGNGPQYSIVPEERHGATALTNGSAFIIVTFDTVMPSSDWLMEAFSIEKAFSEANTFGFGWTITSRSVSGFTVALSGTPDSSDYTLRWQVRGTPS